MRQLFVGVVAVLVLAAVAVSPARAEKWTVKGLHLCCKQCETTIGDILAKVKGVSDAACDRKNGSVTFEAADKGAVSDALGALIKGGFYGKATSASGTNIEVVTSPVSGKSDKVTVKQVHCCCKQCIAAINKLFEGNKVTIDGSGRQRDVTIAGSNLDHATILQTLRKAGYTGKIE
jgi:copper chaperone CopZ